MQHLQSSPLIASNPVANEEICREIDSAVALLSQSIGIRSNSMSSSNSSTGNASGAAAGPTTEAADFSLDGGHVGAILQTTIGKKLMGRSLKLLTPPHRSVRYLFCVNFFASFLRLLLWFLLSNCNIIVL